MLFKPRIFVNLIYNYGQLYKNLKAIIGCELDEKEILKEFNMKTYQKRRPLKKLI